MRQAEAAQSVPHAHFQDLPASHCVVALPNSPTQPDMHLLWLRFNTSMFLAFSSSRGHSVSWL